MKTLIEALCLLTLCSLATSALAQDDASLKVRTEVKKEEVVVDDAGNRQTRLVDAATVLPGDEVIYTVSFENLSDEPAENIVITNPIPEQLIYVDGSAFGPGAEVQFSVDGGQNFGAADELMISDDSGNRQARVDEFTHIRWVLAEEVAPGSQGIAQFRARLN